MICKSAAGMIVLAALLFAASPTHAQTETMKGIFYPDCSPTDGGATTIDLDGNMRITVYSGRLEDDGAYRTQKEIFEGEQATMQVSQCDVGMINCKFLEGVLTTYKVDGESIEGALEYFDGTEVQGDSESIEGHTSYFKVQGDKNRKQPFCG